MSDQRSIVTSSPNHWWASSCTTVSRSSTPAVYTGRVAVSSANPVLDPVKMPPAAGIGYGPNRPDSTSITPLVCRARSAAPAGASGEIADTTGRPSDSVPSTVVNLSM